MLSPNKLETSARAHMRILHLEDSVFDHQLVCNALQDAGQFFTVVRVDTLASYLAAIASQGFDVVVADYHLPGFTAIDAWKATPSEQLLPFILLSGAIGESAAVAAIHLGISDYLHKDEVKRIGRVVSRAVDLQKAKQDKAALDLELQESRNRLAQFASHLQDKIEADRAAIAREIHDDIGGSLAAIRLDLSWVLRHADDPKVAAKTKEAIDMLQHALSASQRIMHNLRPAILDQGLIPSAIWLANSFERRTGVKVQVGHSSVTKVIPKDVELAAYRTIQEALTNISKYAQCSLVKLEISDFDDVLTVDIADNGCGFAKADLLKAKAFGLRGLIERAQSVDGWLDISSQPGKGTAIILSVPLKDRAVKRDDDD